MQHISVVVNSTAVIVVGSNLAVVYPAKHAPGLNIWPFFPPIPFPVNVGGKHSVSRGVGNAF